MNKKIYSVAIIIFVFTLLIIFDKHIIDFLSQYKTPYTLLESSDFWNERVHDWLGDTITLVGVMLAFSLPFTAQVTQWIVSTYGVTTFPEIVKDELKIHTLLFQMFVFVGLVIFWRIFIYEISPYTKSFYILFNCIIAIYFLWILLRLFRVIYYVLRCTFEFRNFIIHPAYNYIKSVTDSIPTPYTEIKDLSIKYLQSMELLRDDEMSSFKRGNILNTDLDGFEKYTWQYIRALITTNDITKIKQAFTLQTELSASIKSMCLVFGKEYYARYVRLASSLAYYSINNKYRFLLLDDDRSISSLGFTNSHEEIFTRYYSDVLFLAEEIECKNNRDYYPILSCRYLLNHSNIGYYHILPNSIDKSFDWKAVFERVDVWENDIVELTKRIIQISSKYQKKSPLLDVYNNLRNDLQATHQREIHLYSYQRQGLNIEDYGVAHKHASKYANILNLADVENGVNFLFSEEFDKYFNIDGNQKCDFFQKLLRIRYKFKIDNLLLFWLGHLSFDTSIIINILEKTSPIDKPRIVDIGEHFLPLDLSSVFRKYLIISNLEYEYSNPFIDLDKYQIVFSTMVLYFLAKTLRNDSNRFELHRNIVNQIHNSTGLSIRNVKSLKEIASLWLESPKGIDDNHGIRNLCVNYGVSFNELLALYKAVLKGIIENTDVIIQQKIIAAPIDQAVINVFYETLNSRFEDLLQTYKFNKEISKVIKPNKKFRFTEIDKEWFINADTGVHYVRDSLDDEFFYKCDYFLKHQKNKTMVIFNDERPSVKFHYKVIGKKINFYCEYNFCFK